MFSQTGVHGPGGSLGHFSQVSIGSKIWEIQIRTKYLHFISPEKSISCPRIAELEPEDRCSDFQPGILSHSIYCLSKRETGLLSPNKLFDFSDHTFQNNLVYPKNSKEVSINRKWIKQIEKKKKKPPPCLFSCVESWEHLPGYWPLKCSTFSVMLMAGFCEKRPRMREGHFSRRKMKLKPGLTSLHLPP